MQWRAQVRERSLRTVAVEAARVRWSGRLLCVLLQELYVDDHVSQLVGDPRLLPLARYPQAVAVALAIRHSWRADDLRRILKRIGISTRSSRNGS